MKGDNMGNRKVVLYIGISLDGYIATKDDSLEWLLNVRVKSRALASQHICETL